MEGLNFTDIWTLFYGLQASRSRRSSALANDARIKIWTSDLNEGFISIRDFIHNVSPSIHGVVEDCLRKPRADERGMD